MNYKYNIGDCHGQEGHRNFYCPDCKSTGASAHAKGCMGTKIAISPSARFPRKNASDKVWKKFYDKFVLCLDWIEWDKHRKDISRTTLGETWYVVRRLEQKRRERNKR